LATLGGRGREVHDTSQVGGNRVMHINIFARLGGHHTDETGGDLSERCDSENKESRMGMQCHVGSRTNETFTKSVKP